jgi:short-subunit dehydrogenase
MSRGKPNGGKRRKAGDNRAAPDKDNAGSSDRSASDGTDGSTDNGSGGSHHSNGDRNRDGDPSRQYATALITGASSGIGRALALTLAHEGTKVFAAARRRNELESLVDEITRAGGRAEALVLDVADADATYDAVSKLDAREPLELVVANAGVGKSTPAKRAPWSDVRQVLSVNVMGAVATLMGALPGMVARNRGHLVGIASLAGFRGLPKFNAYSSSKAALITFLESTRIDLHKTEIAVTTVCPGFVRTDFTANIKSSTRQVELPDAVRIIRNALRGRAAVCTFPRGAAAAMTAVSLLPDSVYDFLVTRAKVPY